MPANYGPERLPAGLGRLRYRGEDRRRRHRLGTRDDGDHDLGPVARRGDRRRHYFRWFMCFGELSPQKTFQDETENSTTSFNA